MKNFLHPRSFLLGSHFDEGLWPLLALKQGIEIWQRMGLLCRVFCCLCKNMAKSCVSENNCFPQAETLFKIRGISSLSWQNRPHPNCEQGHPLPELQGGARLLRNWSSLYLAPWDHGGSGHGKFKKIDYLFCQSSLCWCHHWDCVQLNQGYEWRWERTVQYLCQGE